MDILTPPSLPLVSLCAVELERGLSFVGILALENRLKAETVPHLRRYQVQGQLLFLCRENRSYGHESPTYARCRPF